MSENKKGFKFGAYAVIVFVLIAAFLVTTVTITFKTRYMGFNPDTMAINYVDTIVQKGDGYDAYKYTIMSKNSKFGDFVIENYMKPYIDEDAKQSDLTKDDDGDAKTKFYDTMYQTFTSIITTYGFDDYNDVFSKYFEKAAQVRQEIYGDSYMTTDILFGVFESNVGTYGESLAGSEAIYDKYDETKVIVEAKDGAYDAKFGKDYKFTTAVQDSKMLSDDEKEAYFKTMNADMLTKYDVKTSDIKNVDQCTVTVSLADGTVVATQELNVLQIGSSWYVDNTTIDTSSLYNFYM